MGNIKIYLKGKSDGFGKNPFAGKPVFTRQAALYGERILFAF